MKCDYLSFAVSYKCNLECDHCCVESGPRRSGSHLSVKMMLSLIDNMKAVGDLRRVAFTGGEALLFSREILPAIRHCKQLGVDTRVVTNATWAINEEVASQVAKTYAEAGLTEFAMSYSVYHRKAVPFERYVYATRAALSYGIGIQFLITVCADGDVQVDTVRSKLAEFVGLEGQPITFHASALVQTGRARKLPLGAFEVMQLGSVPKVGCGMVLNPSVVTAENNVMACCGYPYQECDELKIGSLDDGTSLSQMLHQARRNLILRWIHAVGPWRILQTIHPQRYTEETQVLGAHICQGCNLLFSDAENRARLHAYVAERGLDLLFDECFESVAPAKDVP